MMEDFRIKVFMAVVNEGSFTKAASSLGISQAAVSQNVAELEKIAGVRLFDRMRREVVLTSEGLVFKAYAQRIADSYGAMGRMFDSVAQSVVRISASEELYTHMIAPALEDFITVHPGVVFERCLTDAPDLRIVLQPAESEIPSDDELLRLRISASTKKGSPEAALEKVSEFSVLYLPSASFACTRLCRVLKEFIAGF